MEDMLKECDSQRMTLRYQKHKLRKEFGHFRKSFSSCQRQVNLNLQINRFNANQEKEFRESDPTVLLRRRISKLHEISKIGIDQYQRKVNQDDNGQQNYNDELNQELKLPGFGHNDQKQIQYKEEKHYVQEQKINTSVIQKLIQEFIYKSSVKKQKSQSIKQLQKEESLPEIKNYRIAQSPPPQRILKSPLDLKLEKNLRQIPFKRQELEELMSDRNFADIYADFDKFKLQQDEILLKQKNHHSGRSTPLHMRKPIKFAKNGYSKQSTIAFREQLDPSLYKA
eukprot:403348072